jgi:glyoxylase-like metal-dependent hydrolase (beta-lactamase superfamily II)
MIIIKTYILGQLQNNSYLVRENEGQHAVIVDPAFSAHELIEEIRSELLLIDAIWITHAHFDHIAGVKQIHQSIDQNIPVYLHPADLDLWKRNGGADNFGFQFDAGPVPNFEFKDQQTLLLGNNEFLILHTPGHTPGHVSIYNAEQNIVFCGDVIFHHSIGRSDFEGGDQATLIHSIKTKLLSLPDETILYCGHGPATSVKEEKENNPFL